jgi:hypothetical protein
MTKNLMIKLFFLTILAVATTLLTGCRTTKEVNWISRIGTYTFDQAVIELGPPDKQTTLGDGMLVAQWITHRSGGASFGVGTGFYTGGVGVGVSRSVGSGYRDKILTLTFGADRKLVTWSQNY